MDNIVDYKDFMKPKCPYNVGDVIYRKYVHMTLPDPMRVEEIIPTEDGYNLRLRYLQHSMGPYERVYSHKVFENENWILDRTSKF